MLVFLVKETRIRAFWVEIRVLISSTPSMPLITPSTGMAAWFLIYSGSSSVLAVIFTLRAGNSASGYNSIGKYLYENHPIMVKPMNSMEIRTLRLINFFIIIEYAFPFLTFLFCQTGNRHMV